MTYLTIGSLTIPSVWLASIAGLILASLLHWIINGEKIEEWYWNGFFLYFLIWKLSYILFQFKLFLDMPLSIIYFNGGLEGHFLALIILSVYLIFITGKKYPSIYKESARIFLFYFISYQVVINLLEKNQMETLLHIILLAGYIFLLLYLRKKHLTLTIQMFIMAMMLELLILSIFQSLFSTQVWTFTLLGIMMLIVSKKNKEGQKP